MSASTSIESRIVTHVLDFKLTLELVSRLVQADHGDALPTILEVLELERESRHERRVARLRRASRLPTARLQSLEIKFEFRVSDSSMVERT